MTAAADDHGLEHVRTEIARACRDANRDPADVTLVAVSKTFGAEAIEPVIAAGQRVFGENRVQEAKAKWPPLLSQAHRHRIASDRPPPVEQGQGGRGAVRRHPFCRSRQPVRGSGEGNRQTGPSACRCSSKSIPGAEPQKAGVLPQDADAFLAACREKYGLTISGLMCIPPLDEAPGPHFALTAKIAGRNGLKLLSMGMSADFATAIALGATHVRVGSAIFGERT